MMNKNGIITAIFAMIVMTGGMIGFFVSGSNASLISSAIFGTLFLICAYAQTKEQKWADYAAIALSLFLGAFFVKRYFEVHTAMTAIMAVMSFLMAGQLLRSTCKTCCKGSCNSK